MSIKNPHKVRDKSRITSYNVCYTKLLRAFYTRYQDDPLVVDKWFAVQAASSRADTLAQVQTLLHHPALTLKNPNRVRALVGVFAHGNSYNFV